MDMDALAARVKAKRADAGLVADNGLHCPTQAWVDFYNARTAAMAAGKPDAKTAATLNALKRAAIASTASQVSA
jgi:hypothetical protein